MVDVSLLFSIHNVYFARFDSLVCCSLTGEISLTFAKTNEMKTNLCQSQEHRQLLSMPMASTLPAYSYRI